MKTSKLLKKAKKEIETRGWCKGRLVSPDTGAVCSAGAIRAVLLAGNPRGDLTGFERVYYRKAVRALSRNSGYSYLETFNDLSSTRVEDVLALFDTTIKNLKEAGK